MTAWDSAKAAEARKARRDRVKAERGVVTFTEHTGTLADVQVGDFIRTLGGRSFDADFRRYRADASVTAIDRVGLGALRFTTADMRDPLIGRDDYPVQFARPVR